MREGYWRIGPRGFNLCGWPEGWGVEIGFHVPIQVHYGSVEVYRPRMWLRAIEGAARQAISEAWAKVCGP